MDGKTLLNEQDEFFDHIGKRPDSERGSRRYVQRQKRQERRFLRTWSRAIFCLVTVTAMFGLSLMGKLEWAVTFPAALVLIAVASFLAGRLWEQRK